MLEDLLLHEVVIDKMIAGAAGVFAAKGVTRFLRANYSPSLLLCWLDDEKSRSSPPRMWWLLIVEGLMRKRVLGAIDPLEVVDRGHVVEDDFPQDQPAVLPVEVWAS